MFTKDNLHNDGLIHIDLSGPDGNAFYLIAEAVSLARSLKFESSTINEIKKEMMAGDYIQLLKVFDDYFGHMVVFHNYPEAIDWD